MTTGTRQILEENYTTLREMLINGISFQKMAERFGCGAGTVFTFLKEKGENVNKYPCCTSIALKDSQHIIQLHNNGTTAADIARILNYDKQVISSLLKRMGRKNIIGVHTLGVRYNINHNLFDVIDSESKAYYLGLIAADGCVVGNAITIQLKDTDSYILEPLRDLVCPQKPLHNYSNGNSNSVRLVWRSDNTIESLLNFGITPRKSLTMGGIASSLPNEFIHHFIRGYFDGDGWITKTTYRNKNRVAVGMIGTKEFLEDVKECIGLPVGGLYQVKDIENLYKLVYCGKGRMFELKDYLYKDSTIFLHRKKDKFVW